MKRTRNVLFFGSLGLLAMILCVASVVPDSARLDQLKSRFAERAGQIWFNANDFAADVSLDAALMFAAIEARLCPGSQQPLSGPNGNASPLTHVAEDDI